MYPSLGTMGTTGGHALRRNNGLPGVDAEILPGMDQRRLPLSTDQKRSASHCYLFCIPRRGTRESTNTRAFSFLRQPSYSLVEVWALKHALAMLPAARQMNTPGLTGEVSRGREKGKEKKAKAGVRAWNAA